MTTLFDNADVISLYTRSQAISDGVMVDVSELAREAGFRYPVALTRAAWADLVAWDSANRSCQDETGRLWDVLNGARWGATRGGGARKLLRLWRVPNTARATVPRTATFVLHCGPGHDGEPVVTIMAGAKGTLGNRPASAGLPVCRVGEVPCRRSGGTAAIRAPIGSNGPLIGSGIRTSVEMATRNVHHQQVPGRVHQPTARTGNSSA